MNLRTLIKSHRPLLLPGASDALTARLIERAGFSAYGIGGAALAATQLALPDVGLQSFGEYCDGIRRIQEGSSLPVLIDGENGFGDLKAVTRTTRVLERLGVAGIAFEDLTFPPVLGVRPTIIDLQDMTNKLEASLSARQRAEMFIIGRTDAAHVVGIDEALKRVACFEALGVDAVLATGLASKEDMQRVRDAVKVPVVAVVVPGSPWLALSAADLAEIGIEMALYPGTTLLHMAGAIRDSLKDIASGRPVPETAMTIPELSQALRTDGWAEIDARWK